MKCLKCFFLKVADNFYMTKKILLLFFYFFLLNFVFSQEALKSELHISFNDLYMIPERDSNFNLQGFHLYIKKKPGINSIMLIETTKDSYLKY